METIVQNVYDQIVDAYDKRRRTVFWVYGKSRKTTLMHAIKQYNLKNLYTIKDSPSELHYSFIPIYPEYQKCYFKHDLHFYEHKNINKSRTPFSLVIENVISIVFSISKPHLNHPSQYLNCVALSLDNPLMMSLQDLSIKTIVYKKIETTELPLTLQVIVKDEIKNLLGRTAPLYGYPRT